MEGEKRKELGKRMEKGKMKVNTDEGRCKCGSGKCKNVK